MTLPILLISNDLLSILTYSVSVLRHQVP